MKLRMAGASDIGRVRKNNQDSFFCDPKLGIAIVCDGIGGRKSGDVASKLAVDTMRNLYQEADVLRSEEVNSFLSASVDKTNTTIINAGKKDPSRNGMGTTMNFLMFVNDKLHIAHVGDSRTYLFHQNQLFTLTIDHNIRTFVERGWMMRGVVQAGTRDAALVRSLGLSEHCEADIYNITTKPGQIFLTCTDGLTEMMDDFNILQIFKNHHHANLEHLAQTFVDEANRNGGKDNVTVVLSQIRDV